MKKPTWTIAAALGLICGASLLMMGQRQRASAHESVTATLNGKKVTIEYGRPQMKGREIFGKLVPYGQVWRTGADEATTLTTEGDLMLGSLHVPAGTYSLFTLPTEKEWTIIVNKTAKQWGAFKYDAGADVGRAKMSLKSLPSPVEVFTIALEAQGGKGTLKMHWEKTEASIPIMMH
jgi:hypothetical protein